MKHKHHKIIFKNGQRIRTNELVEYTIEEHAAEHKRLWKKGKHWKDYVAWQGLSGQIKSKDVIMEVYRQNGKVNGVKNFTKEVRKKAIENARKTNTGRKLTKEHKAKIVRTGQKQPQSQKDKVREAVSKEYIITTPQGRTFAIKNLLEFARKNNLDQGNLVKVAQRKLNSHKGFIVAYK